MLKCYLKKIGKANFIKDYYKVNFLFNANSIKFNDNTPIEKFFANFSDSPPSIFVNFINK